MIKEVIHFFVHYSVLLSLNLYVYYLGREMKVHGIQDLT